MSSHLGAALETFRKQQAQKAAEAVQAATQPKVLEQLQYLKLHVTRLVNAKQSFLVPDKTVSA